MKSLATLLALLPVPAMAQAYQCVLPRTIRPIPAAVPDGPAHRASITGYTLAASWSPDYCKSSGDVRSMQCSGANGRFGFVLHGLWPEGGGDASPQWCTATSPPPPDLLRRNLCMTPSPELQAHEWAKHGTCMARRPETYFKVSTILWRSIRWPDADHLSRKPGLTAGDLRDEFVALNRGWRRDSVGIELGRTGWLRELRLCYGKDFRPARCRQGHYGPPDDAPLKIWRGL